LTLKPALTPSGASAAYTWASSQPGVATVSQSGTVTGMAVGSAVITVTTDNGKSANATVNVVGPPLSLTSVTSDKAEYALGETATVTAAATGGTAPVQYQFRVYREGQSAVYAQGVYTTGKTYAFKPTEAGRYSVQCSVQDAAGVTANASSAWFTVITPSSSNNSQSFIEEVVRLVNIERAKAGLSALSGGNSALNGAAAARANELLRLYSHTRPNGAAWHTILGEKGISYKATGENIAAGYDTAAEVVSGWMDSPGHRANILNASYTSIGVGYAFSSGTTYEHYWAQIFLR